MGSIEPTGEQIKALTESDSDAPIVMLNLLRFRDEADYPQGFAAEPCSGEHAYGRYAEGALAAVQRVGGTPIWGGNVQAAVIAPESEAWDQAFLVRYPSRAKFVEMVSDPEYQAIVPHRSAALSDSRLILCDAPEAAPTELGAAE